MSSLPVSALPLSAEQTTSLYSAVGGLSTDQLQWVSGYVAGLAAAGNTAIEPVAAANTGARLTVLYGSQTGNGEEVARELAGQVEAQGFATQLTSLADYKPASLKRERHVAFVLSTHGEGDPPDDAELFREFLLADKAPILEHLRYAVLALGDSSYVNFCQTGREFDKRLAELGAKRFHDLIECDLDYESTATIWSNGVAATLPELLRTAAVPSVTRLHAVENSSVYDKNNPFEAEVLVNQKITGVGSSKDVRHLELSLEDSGLVYEPGDSLAVIAQNPPQLVEQLLQVLDLSVAEPVCINEQPVEVAEALRSKLEITGLNVGFLRDWAANSGSEVLTALLEPEAKELLADFMATHQVIDVVREFPARVDAQQFVNTLRKLSPRSYSIASSLAANPDEVHLTVAEVRYEAFGSEHWGAASTQLVDRLDAGDTVSVFVERNSRFRLPSSDVPVIMIGPGTGVAPFRAFVEERAEQGTNAGNWLFFGDRNFDSDFLYQLEWQRHLKQGNLSRLDLAFSRDQRQKIYVQDRIRENGEDLYQWIERGAAIYVCGDAKRMAGDVHEALIDVIVDNTQVDRETAEQQLKELRSAGRYRRDVY